MKLLVTGGAGFIGSNFVRYWLEKHPSDQIVNVDKLTYAGNLRSLDCLAANHQFHRKDICDGDVEELLPGVDVVVHFAAESHVDRSIDGSEIFVRTNVLGTQRLLEAARRQGVERFLQIGTDEVYGALGESGEFTEESPLLPNSPYAASKAAADLLARSYFQTHKLPVIITRACNNYGPYQHPEKFIPLMVTNGLAGLPLPVYGQGAQIREWIHVMDHCRALEAVIQRGRPGQVYNIGTGCCFSNLEMVESILRLLDKPSSLIHFVADRPGHDFRYALSSVKARQQLQWEPETDLEKGLAQTIRWYGENRSWVESARNASFQQYYTSMYESREGYRR
ncbi:MAG: dTDP-glucose 4,6-dehydratase [Acidobacteria bacterium]|nr:dTDP-glucose 4,6-dehydratase [Acidobacteriota bacterium]